MCCGPVYLCWSNRLCMFSFPEWENYPPVDLKYCEKHLRHPSIFIPESVQEEWFVEEKQTRA